MAKIKLPFCYKLDKTAMEVLGWENGDPETGCLVVRKLDSDSKLILSVERSLNLLLKLKLNPKQIPGKRVETVSGKDWERFQRFKEKAKELEEIADETLYNWKGHLRWLQQEFTWTDNDGELEDVDNAVRRTPRLLKYVRTGCYPPDDMDDDDLA